MRAVMASVPPEILEWRKRTGADRFDEMWEGVLHMVAAPNREHQDFRWSLETFLRLRWSRCQQFKVYSEVNVAPAGDWPRNYRIPDLILLTPERYHIDRNEFFEGAPEVVVEIRSPDDESYEKLAFYAALGVPECWIIERDSKHPEVFRLAEGTYLPQPATENGWVPSLATDLEMRAEGSGKFLIRESNRPDSQNSLPY
ncbi:MAG: Uma2 family endonuclease [Candidatus Eremiobacteraeota bacterium]|nr:Uma2 family endonuclease [Candidatus Eremiobacteraeota bacterium]